MIYNTTSVPLTNGHTMQMLTYTVEFLLIISVLVLLLHGINCYYLLYHFVRQRKQQPARDADTIAGFWAGANKLPLITIQLPVYNEYYVVERLIRRVCQLDYPTHLLEIQLLDDSDDDTGSLIARLAAEYQCRGFNLRHLRRKDRQGYKAGALKEGLKQAKGEYVAIFDADFLPPRDFLRQTLPFFTDKQLAAVQSRWGHINADYSLLTMAQSIAIDGHFTIEQGGRCWSGLLSSFNGTAGLWRKQAIVDAGDWQSDTLTEDIDLSYRVQLKGWRIKFLSLLETPAELPTSINALKSQQYRWAKGSIQTAKKLIPRVLRSDLDWRQKYQACLHLTHYLIHPMMVLVALLGLILLLLKGCEIDRGLFGFLLFCLIFSIGGSSAVYSYSQRFLYPDWKKRLPYVLVLTVVGVGIALNNTRALLSGIMGGSAEFIRTPKLNVIDKHQHLNGRYHLPLDRWFIWELVMGSLCWWGFCLYLIQPGFLIGPLLLIYAVGFFYVGLLSLIHHLKGSFSGCQEPTEVMDISCPSDPPL
jgi:cellulose synthase/poly-beta-1,6-N-acetylglucosamine synthase-like glycosyltransferase